MEIEGHIGNALPEEKRKLPERKLGFWEHPKLKIEGHYGNALLK